MEKQRYSLTEIQKIFGLSHNAVWKWVRGISGEEPKIKGYQLVERGKWFVDAEELAEHCKKMGLDWDEIRDRATPANPSDVRPPT